MSKFNLVLRIIFYLVLILISIELFILLSLQRKGKFSLFSRQIKDFEITRTEKDDRVTQFPKVQISQGKIQLPESEKQKIEKNLSELIRNSNSVFTYINDGIEKKLAYILGKLESIQLNELSTVIKVVSSSDSAILSIPKNMFIQKISNNFIIQKFSIENIKLGTMLICSNPIREKNQYLCETVTMQ